MQRYVVALLGQPQPVHLAVLLRRRDKTGVGFEDQETALLLPAERRHRARRIPRRDDAVADHAGQQRRQFLVHRVGHGGEVAVGGLRVGVTGADVGAGQRAAVEVGAVERRGGGIERAGERGAGRRDVLERRRRGPSQRPGRVPDQLPAAQRVQQVDVRRLAVEHPDRPRARAHGHRARGVLLGVGSVPQIHVPASSVRARGPASAGRAGCVDGGAQAVDASRMRTAAPRWWSTLASRDRHRL